MKQILLKNGNIVLPYNVIKADVLIDGDKIAQISENIQCSSSTCVDISGLYIFPGIIDTHVHFRDPGLTHKADIYTESKSAVAGGVTTVIDMPNTVPYAGNIREIKNKKSIAQEKSLVNMGFFIGANSENLDELLSVNKKEVAGIKLFMGSSTGNVLIEDDSYLHNLFAKSKLPIVVHAEDDGTIKRNIEKARSKFGENIPFREHSNIRSREACILSTKKAIHLAIKYKTDLHLLHVSTKEELELIDFELFPNITTEVCLPHLWFYQDDFDRLKGKLKCNPSVKTKEDRDYLRQMLESNSVFSIGTDHAPHTLEEKNNNYLQCPSGMPFIQHSLPCILELYHQGLIKLNTIALKMAYNPAQRFSIDKRGSIKVGNYADLTIVNINKPNKITQKSLLYKCQWSPLMGEKFSSSIEYTFVNGNLVYNKGNIDESIKGMLVEYNR